MADKPEKPVEPSPSASAAEWHAYAQANAKWSDWIKDHPDDDKPAKPDPIKGPDPLKPPASTSRSKTSD